MRTSEIKRGKIKELATWVLIQCPLTTCLVLGPGAVKIRMSVVVLVTKSCVMVGMYYNSPFYC